MGSSIAEALAEVVEQGTDVADEIEDRRRRLAELQDQRERDQLRLSEARAEIKRLSHSINELIDGLEEREEHARELYADLFELTRETPGVWSAPRPRIVEEPCHGSVFDLTEHQPAPSEAEVPAPPPPDFAAAAPVLAEAVEAPTGNQERPKTDESLQAGEGVEGKGDSSGVGLVENAEAPAENHSESDLLHPEAASPDESPAGELEEESPAGELEEETPAGELEEEETPAGELEEEETPAGELEEEETPAGELEEEEPPLGEVEEEDSPAGELEEEETPAGELEEEETPAGELEEEEPPLGELEEEEPPLGELEEEDSPAGEQEAEEPPLGELEEEDSEPEPAAAEEVVESAETIELRPPPPAPKPTQCEPAAAEEMVEAAETIELRPPPPAPKPTQCEPAAAEEMVEAAEAIEPRPPPPAEESVAPESAEEPAMDRRGHTRRNLTVEVGMHGETNFWLGFSQDISEGGLFIATYETLPVGTEVDLEFSLPGSPGALHSSARVCWVREYREGQDLTNGILPGMGVRFEGLAEGERQRIADFVRTREALFVPGFEEV